MFISSRKTRCKYLHAIAIAAIGTFSTSPIRAQETPNGPEYTQPLGIAMETWPYPFPVKFFPVTWENQRLQMAYMDVAPTANVNAAAPRVAVLLHGKNFYGGYWENTIRALTGAGWRVIVPDQIGFGKSSKPEIAYSFDFLAQNTVALLSSLNVERADIVAHSMGGMLAVRIERNFPNRVRKLALVNPIGLEDYRFKVPPQNVEKLFQSELENTKASSHRAFLKNYFVTWKPEYETFVEWRTRIALSGEYPRWAKASALTTQMIYQQPVRHKFSLIKAPTLLQIGLQDRTFIGRNQVTPQVAATLGQYRTLGKQAARDIPNSSLIEYPNAAHLPQFEVREQFHRDLLNWLQK